MGQVEVKFRMRVYQAADGTIEVIFGNDPVEDSSWKLLKDQDVVETKVVKAHVEPAPQPEPAPAPEPPPEIPPAA